MGGSRSVLSSFPEDIKDAIGYALYVAQRGGKHTNQENRGTAQPAGDRIRTRYEHEFLLGEKRAQIIVDQNSAMRHCWMPNANGISSSYREKFRGERAGL